MPHIDELIADLDTLLEPAAFRDYGPNGLQVPGAERVSRVATGVSANRELIERAVEAQAQMLLVHHGLFWEFMPPGLTPTLAGRLRPLFRHDLNLAAYHLPLDGHEVVGNNALLAQALGCVRHEPFAETRGRRIGRIGHFDPEPIAADDLFASVHEVTGREPLVFDAGPPRVRRIGIVSGSAAKALPEAVALGLDAFLTGEPAEHVMADAREARIHFIAAGHYATETFGVKALGERLAQQFGIEHVFIDVPNPI
ncbi:MAG: Nif3-like dinuclear metal center hexameric protein [Actinomycetota bacterium]|nr:Nif3-like dinuclear metal center hexameric protein [Actinomycetota bacterium]